MDPRINVFQPDSAPDVAVVLVENPPVNVMSIGVPGGIIEAVDRLNDNDSVKGILIAAGGTGVLGGADIKVQGKKWPEGEPNLIDLIDRLDSNDKPIGILLRKTAVGGGLEIAMSCRYRVAQAGTMVGQPEVKLGIPPGAGGTQRLPRLVGAEKALEMILSGEPISVEEGYSIGLIDGLVSADDPIAEAARYLSREVASGQIHQRTRERGVAVDGPRVFDTERARVAKRFRGQTAPVACIDCVEMATKTEFDEGFAYERKRFLECVTADEAVALRHVFFAERQARKVPGIATDIVDRPVDKAAVLGAGTMGSGIAMCFANAGIPVTMIERDAEALQRGLDRVAATYVGQASKGRMDEATAAAHTALVSGELNLEAAGDADVIVEAVFEDMDVKKSVFADLAKIAKPGAVLATNTSYLNVDAIAAAAAGRETDVLGLHFFSPANIMKLLEVVRAAKTADDVLVTGLKLGQRLGKTAIVSGVCHGFIGNRMFSQYNREADFLLQEGATVDQVDKALYDFGMAMGSFSVRDLAGLDIGWAMRKSTAHLRKPEVRYSTVCDEICERGWYGQKTGKGFYVYEDGKKTVNPDVQAIVDETGKAAGIVPGNVTDEQIVERCIYALVNEGAKILDEGIALRASDIDLVFINGYGFPRWRGGPMHYADTVGLEKVLSTIRSFDEDHDFWTPAPLLERLAAEGKSFADWDKENAS